MIHLLLAALLAQSAPLKPEEAPGKMTLPEGFKAVLFAGEPDVVQPMAFTFDDRGRLWVVENFSYPKWVQAGETGKDQILIFEDENGDGRYDRRKVFASGLSNVSGIAFGHGGVWITALPTLAFIPDRNGDDVPDGPAEVLLDGWDMKAKHNVFSKPTWGPDGWLYGCNGILSQSKVGKPGAPEADRVPVNCGVWRFHPATRVFEVVARGTTNPWGLDFDAVGRLFITNCVIKHLFHVVPGAHYVRMFGEDNTANLYGLMESCADHLHWAGGAWQQSRSGENHSEAGGGHAHVGAMVYLGDNWPDAYRGNLFTMNLHGHRMNRDVLETKGSGVVAKHGKDLLLANDPWFRGLDCQYGPDGGVFVTDWTDTGECHDYDKVEQDNGRIYKITYGDVKPVKVDLSRLDDAALVELQKHKNEWFVRHARRLLHERAIEKKKIAPGLLVALYGNEDPVIRLRALWLMDVTDQRIADALKDPGEHVRAWGVTQAFEHGDDLKPLVELAASDPSPVVRLALASGLQRLAPEARIPIAERLVAHEEDANDAFLPLMVWYAVEPIAALDRARAVSLLSKSKIPLVRQYLTRRMASLAK